MFLNSSDGDYTLSFFSIYINTNEDVEDAIKNNKATFIHEFVHYLQDLILPYNIRVNMSNIQWFSRMREVAINCGSIKRPFTQWTDDAKNTKMQYQYTIGDNRDIEDQTNLGEIKMSVKEVKAQDPTRQDGFRTFNVHKHSIFITNQKSEYKLGARDLLEYIAYKIESRQCLTRENSPQFPYKTIDYLFDRYDMSDIGDDVRVCVAECCLYNDNPMHFLFQQFLENEDIKPLLRSNYTYAYNYFLNWEFESTDKIKETLYNKRIRRLIQFKVYLENNYSNYPEIVNWVSNVVNFSSNSLCGRFVFSDMYRMDKEQFCSFIKEIIAEIGIPLLLNKKGQYKSITYKDSRNNQFVEFYILQRFLSFTTDSDFESKFCPIKKFCKANYSVDCNIGPIFDRNKQIKKIEGCPLAEFLNEYGLSEIRYE